MSSLGWCTRRTRRRTHPVKSSWMTTMWLKRRSSATITNLTPFKNKCRCNRTSESNWTHLPNSSRVSFGRRIFISRLGDWPNGTRRHTSSLSYRGSHHRKCRDSTSSNKYVQGESDVQEVPNVGEKPSDVQGVPNAAEEDPNVQEVPNVQEAPNVQEVPNAGGEVVLLGASSDL